MVEYELEMRQGEKLILRDFDRAGDRKELSKDLVPY